MSDTHEQQGARVHHLPWSSLVVGIVATVICLVGAATDATQFFRAYAFSYFFFLGFPLGSLTLIMVHHLTGGAWGLLVRHYLYTQIKTLPLLALLFIPIAVGMPDIYRWYEEPSQHALASSFRPRYLTPEFFYWRAAGYFSIWLLLAGLLVLWRHRDTDATHVRTVWKCEQLSGPGLIAIGITMHFAAIDWIMSLQTEFASTIVGLAVFSGFLLSGFSLALYAYCRDRLRGRYGTVASEEVNGDLGNLLLTFLLLWAYMNWFQFLLIWIANLPRGTKWYLARFREGWDMLALTLVILHFVVPFLLLLWRNQKRNPYRLGRIAVWILLIHLPYVYLLIMPTYGTLRLAEHWMDPLMPLAIGGFFAAAFWWLGRHEPRIEDYDLNYAHAHELKLAESHES